MREPAPTPSRMGDIPPCSPRLLALRGEALPAGRIALVRSLR